MRPLCLITALLFIFATFTPLTVKASASAPGPCVCMLDGSGCAGQESCPVVCPHHGGHGSDHDEGDRGNGAEEGRGDEGHGVAHVSAPSDGAPGRVLRCGCADHGGPAFASLDQPFVTDRPDRPVRVQPACPAPPAGSLYSGPSGAVPDRPPSA